VAPADLPSPRLADILTLLEGKSTIGVWRFELRGEPPP
jgi:hypothetical protein